MRAQINPHFIFNCLASIQYFIADNDAASATRYLSRFARLVRLALHGSVDGRHSLREEMDMLENYLALEQMRFRGAFVFSVEADPELESDAVLLPPMLV
ncbi:MAG: histidine kinase [Saprospiraceae bacterium]